MPVAILWLKLQNVIVAELTMNRVAMSIDL